MQEIQGKTRSVRELLSGAKYGIDYYQREYKWQTKQMAELVSDLTGAFLEDYQEAHQRADVAHYGHYFLGSIVISQRDNERLIVDGQQRMTSLTLLLLYLHSQQKGLCRVCAHDNARHKSSRLPMAVLNDFFAQSNTVASPVLPHRSAISPALPQ